MCTANTWCAARTLLCASPTKALTVVSVRLSRASDMTCVRIKLAIRAERPNFAG